MSGILGAVNVRDRYDALVARGPSVERVTFFSDAVFAISLTLLVLEIRIPDVAPALLGRSLLGLVPDVGAFALSFVVVGIAWMSHHRKFRQLRGHDQALLRLNLLLLLVVAALPVPTALLARYGDTVLAVVIYATAIVLTGLLTASVWVLAERRGLLIPAIDGGLFRFMLGQSLVIPTVFAVSIPVAALAGPLAAELSWLLALPLYVVLGRVAGRRSTEPRSDKESS